MNDYLEIYKKFDDVKEIKDYIDDVMKLRQYYYTQQYDKMIEHINSLKMKYFLDSVAWNGTHTIMPTTYQEYYQNAELFMQAQGAKIIASKVADYAKRLSPDEIAFVESMIKQPME